MWMSVKYFVKPMKNKSSISTCLAFLKVIDNLIFPKKKKISKLNLPPSLKQDLIFTVTFKAVG